LKQSVQADLPALATLVTDKARRSELFTRLQAQGPWAQQFALEDLVEHAPLVEVVLPTLASLDIGSW